MGASDQPNREQLEAWDKTHCWHAFTQMSEYESLLFESGEDCWLTDADGNRYIDAISSLWCNVHGHRHPKLDQAITDQLKKIAHATNLGSSNSTTVRLARKLVELSPEGLEHVFFSDDGATSVEVALKMAFQYWHQCEDPKPEKISYLALSQAYHGDTLGDVSVGGVALFHKMFQPLLFEVHRADAPDLYRLPEGVTEATALEYYLNKVEEILKEHHETIAAVIAEAIVQGAAGIIVQPEGYLKGLRELTKKYNVLLIADEVATGMGRTGTLFASEQEGVTPDFICLAKGLTGGYLPMAATLTTNEIYNAFLGDYAEFKAFFHGHTYGGNPLGAAVSLACLEVFEEEQTLEKMKVTVARLEEHLQKILELPHVGHVRNRGLMAGIELVSDKENKTPYPAEEKWGMKLCLAARKYGVLLRPLGNVITILPPLTISVEQIDQIADAITKSIQEITEG